MKNNIIKGMTYVVCLLAFALVSLSVAASAEEVSPKGETTIKKVFKKNTVAVTISTREVDIGKPSEQIPEVRDNSCTYSRYPCSLVYRIDIKINERNIFVPRSVYSDLADINTTTITSERGIYIIILQGGDASESYKALIKLNHNRILSRELWDNESGQKLQETKYFTAGIN